jgi:galactose mutarotase-like enzyme
VFTLPQHGFARDLPWQLAPLAAGRGIALELRHSPASLAAYPFPFQLRLEATLEPAALAIRVTVTNGAAEEVMPFSFGLHPYFAVSDLEAVQLEGLPDACFDHHTMASSPTADQLTRLAEGIDLLCQPAVPVRLVDRGAGRVIVLESTHPWDLAVLWTDPPRPMVCLEPWTGPRQALLSGDHRLDLAPGATLELRSRFVVESL